jgi:lipopolysaccharide/colanic/teichoic acid biosynthesis glycosyltransferase
MKRIFEFSAAFMILFFLCPLLISISFILFLTGEHKIFHFSNRVGLNKKIFNMVKFSTMLKNNPNINTLEIKLKDDPSILPIGRFLRKTKIDEIPQLLNILKGEMGFIGPRPLLPRYFNYYTPQQQEMISLMKPGITGIGSIYFRDEASLIEQSCLLSEQHYELFIAPQKAALEKWYYENMSVCLDIKILLCTLLVIFNRKSKAPRKLFKGLPEMKFVN